jgi:hypothetical protein
LNWEHFDSMLSSSLLSQELIPSFIITILWLRITEVVWLLVGCESGEHGSEHGSEHDL